MVGGPGFAAGAAAMMLPFILVVIAVVFGLGWAAGSLFRWVVE